MKALALATSAMLLLVSTTLLTAQDLETLERGARVRLTTGASGKARLKGTVYSTDPMTLTILSDDHQLVTVPRAQVSRLEMGWGRTGRSRRGFVIGALVGAVSGIAVALDPTGPCYAEECPALTTGEKFGLAAGVTVIYGAMGAGIGALIKTDRWVDTPLSKVRVSVGPSPGRGVAARIAFRF